MSKSTAKSKKEYIGLAYIRTREQYLNSIGIFRCDAKVDGKELCNTQCDKCKNYY